MVARKKPVGTDWDALVEQYKKSTHAEKLELANKWGVTYDVLKHWITEGKSDPAPVCSEPKTKDEPYEQTEILESITELLATPVGIDLDFCSFDLETTNLKADFGIILTGALKPYGRDTMVWRGDSYPTWDSDRANDRAIVTDIYNELKRHAVIITHYGTGFDIPYLRAKMMFYGLPQLPPMFGVDTYQIAKKNMLLARRRLETISAYLGLGVKHGVEGNLWIDASMNGSKHSMDMIVKHNVVDVELLEKLACICFPYMRSIGKL